MNIKTIQTTPTPVDVSEWNDEIKAFVRPLDGFESLVFNDWCLDFYRKDNSNDERFDAAFKAAVDVLVDEEGNKLLDEGDRDAIRRASFLPFFRIFTAGLGQTSEIESAKKN